MEDIDIQLVAYHSDWQKQAVSLRYKILREPLGLHFTAEQLAAECDDFHIVVIKQHKVIGVLLLKKLDAQTIKMRQVAIDTNFQNLGIGKQLVQFAESFIQQHQFKKIELHARESAIQFYLKLDYSIVGNKFIEVGLPHFKMKKEF